MLPPTVDATLRFRARSNSEQMPNTATIGTYAFIRGCAQGFETVAWLRAATPAVQ